MYSSSYLRPSQMAAKRRKSHSNVLRFICTLAILVTFSPVMAAETVDTLESRIKSTSDRSAPAGLYKQLGDQLLAQDKITEAAEAFSQALRNDRDRFSTSERVQMAVYLSWADRLKEAARELRAVLAREPKNLEARIQLARVLSWDGDLSLAVEEAETALKESPENRQALLIKADALQWQGRYREAIPIYRQLVEKYNDFDARVGLSRSLLATGDRSAAIENTTSIKAANSRQERELEKLTDAMNRETRPSIDARHNRYTDSDHNRLNRYSLSSSFWIDNYKLGAAFRHTDADDKTRHNRAEDLSFTYYSHVTDSIAAGLGLGFTQLGDGHTTNFPTGQFRIDTRLFRGTAGANINRDVLSDTAELIESRIRMTSVGLYLSQPLTDRFSVYAGYNYKNFSDGNHANDLQLVSQYSIYLTPRITIGHRFRLLDFQKQTGSGYFDPNDYISNRAFASIYFEHRLFYTYLEGYAGYQTFRRNGVASDDFIRGGSGSIGLKPVANLAIELNVEGGNFAAGSTSGFSYFIIGPRVLYRF